MSIYLAIYVTAVLLLVCARLDEWNKRVNRPIATALAGLATSAAFLAA